MYYVGTYGKQDVALLAEGVDRNSSFAVRNFSTISSPSSRRAWIEIRLFAGRDASGGVALLAEGVDRNNPRRGPKS